MATTLNEQKLIDANKRALLKYVFISDGTAQANVTLVDASNLRYALNTSNKMMTSNTNPKSIYRTSIKRVFGSAKLANSIKLQWGGVANTEFLTFNTGSFDYNFDFTGNPAVIPIVDPANCTGDIVMSTVGTPSANDTFTLFIELKKEGRDYDQGQTADPSAFDIPGM